MKNKTKLRFNLGRGENYMKWQVKPKDGPPQFYDPGKHQILVHGATLKNQKWAARKIYRGANKTVCAWVECDHVSVIDNNTLPAMLGREILQYNPKVEPFWRNHHGQNIDDQHFARVFTDGRTIYAI